MFVHLMTDTEKLISHNPFVKKKKVYMSHGGHYKDMCAYEKLYNSMVVGLHGIACTRVITWVNDMVDISSFYRIVSINIHLYYNMWTNYTT